MENGFEEPVQLSKGIKLHDLLTSSSEFSIDVDFKKNKTDLTIDREFFDDLDEDSDGEDALQIIEESASKMVLSCPEYHSFSDLATKMIDCLSSGDVKLLILEEGDGPLIPVDAEVTIHYAAYWEKDKIPFDCTLTMNNGTPKQIKLGRGGCIPGLEIGLSMVKGPKARFLLLIQPALAWGPRGVLPRVRPEPALFVIIVYTVNDLQAPIRFNDLPSAEQTKYEVTTRTVNSLHMQAKDFFAKKKYNKCIKNYQQSMSVLNLSVVKSSTEEAEVKRLRINTYVNLAVCYFKINKPKYVINMCENLDFITDIEKHCKALFYNGRAFEMLGKTEDALKYYKMALKLEPKNRDIGKALANLDQYIKKSAAKEKELWQNALRLAPEKKKNVYDVDVDFQNTVRDMCQNLAGSDEYTKFELPASFTSKEINCIKDLCSEFKGLIVQEDGEGKKKKVCIIRMGA